MNRQPILFSNHLKIICDYLVLSDSTFLPTDAPLILPYADILSIDLVRRRSKKIMYASFIPVGVLSLLFGVEDVLRWVLLLVAFVFFVAVGAVYLRIVHSYIEIVTMQGTFRIAVQRDEVNQAASVIAELQQRALSSHYGRLG